MGVGAMGLRILFKRFIRSAGGGGGRAAGVGLAGVATAAAGCFHIMRLMLISTDSIRFDSRRTRTPARLAAAVAAAATAARNAGEASVSLDGSLVAVLVRADGTAPGSLLALVVLVVSRAAAAAVASSKGELD